VSGGNEETRDRELGASVRNLYVPPPGPDFYPRLLARLEEEAASARAERQRRRFRPRIVPALAAVASVAAVVLAVTWVGLPGRDDQPGLFGPGPAAAITADEVRQRVGSALAQTRTLEGDLTVDTNQRGASSAERFRFVVSAEGDFRVTAVDGQSDKSYSTRQGVQRSFSTVAASGALLASESRGLATGPPDPAPDASVLARQLGALARAFVGSRADVAVRETTYDGRSAWNLVVPLSRAPIPAEDAPGGPEIDITVDQQTGFPLQSIERRRLADGTLMTVREVRLSNLVADQPVSPDRFVLTFPSGAGPVDALDQGFRRVALAEAAATVGYGPLLPARVPEGFKLAEVAVARSAPATADGRNPLSRDVVSVAYQRGFDRFVISTRSVGTDPAVWVDPLTSRTSNATVERFTPSAGRLRGAQGELVGPSGDAPHVWLLSERLVVTVSGDLTGQELLAIVDSL
jgi:hypothetical protein